MEAIPKVDLDLLRHTLLDVVTDGLGILCEKLVKVEASHALNVDVLVRLLFEESGHSLHESELVFNSHSSSDEKATISESELNVKVLVLHHFLLDHEVVPLLTSSMDIFEAFLYFQVDAEVDVSSGVILLDELFRSTDSSLQVGNVLLGVLSEERGVNADAAAFSGLLDTGSVKVDLDVVGLVLVNSRLSLFSKFLEGVAHALESSRASEFSSEDLAHGSRASVATREPPELELLRTDLAVTVEVDVSHHVVELSDVQVDSERCSDHLEFSSVDESILVVVELCEHLVDVSLNCADASLHVLGSSSVVSSAKDLGVLEFSSELYLSHEGHHRHVVEPDEGVSEEVVVISFFDNHNSGLEPGGDLSGSDKGGFALEALLLEVADLVVSLLGCLGDDEELSFRRLCFDHLFFVV